MRARNRPLGFCVAAVVLKSARLQNDVMRALLFILILIVVAALIAVWTGFLDINMMRPARAPDVNVNGAGVTASNGQTPTFDIETGSVAVGTRSTNVTVPTVRVVKPGEEANNVTANGI